MSNTFSIAFNWLSRQYGDAIERATLAEIKISADDSVITELEDINAKTIRQSVRVSAYNAALWFASNWWRLLWEPERNTLSWRMCHKLGAAGGGYLWPDISFSSDGYLINVLSRETTHKNDQSVRYLHNFEIPVPVDDFKNAIDVFIEAIISRLLDEGISESDLASIWKDVLEERKDSKLSQWRKLEAILGYDPDEAPEEIILGLQDEAARYGESAIEEMAASSGNQAKHDIDVLWNYNRSHAASLQIPDSERLRDIIIKSMKPAKPWEQAEIAASIVRGYWDLPSPIETDKLSDLLSLSQDAILGHNGAGAKISAGFRDSHPDKISIVFGSMRHSNRRFALSRLIGDHLITSINEKLLPITKVKTQRQKFQKAFAQELLCPYAKLEEFLNDKPLSEEAIEDAADYFLVSPLTISTTLVNKGRLNRSFLSDYSR